MLGLIVGIWQSFVYVEIKILGQELKKNSRNKISHSHAKHSFQNNKHNLNGIIKSSCFPSISQIPQKRKFIAGKNMFTHSQPPLLFVK